MTENSKTSVILRFLEKEIIELKADIDKRFSTAWHRLDEIGRNTKKEKLDAVEKNEQQHIDIIKFCKEYVTLATENANNKLKLSFVLAILSFILTTGITIFLFFIRH